MYRDTSVAHEIYDNLSHRNSKKKSLGENVEAKPANYSLDIV